MDTLLQELKSACIRNMRILQLPIAVKTLQ